MQIFTGKGRDLDAFDFTMDPQHGRFTGTDMQVGTPFLMHKKQEFRDIHPSSLREKVTNLTGKIVIFQKLY
jgi:hypothetical protein